MRYVLIVLCVLCLVLLALPASAGPLGLMDRGGSCSACPSGSCAVPVEVRIEKAAVAEKTKAVAKSVVTKTEEAVEVGKGRLKKMFGRIIHRRK